MQLIKRLPIIATAYALTINIASFGLFFYDKQQALNKGWRVPEKSLHVSALLGGWLGGLLAIDKFRHKTKKQPFRTIYHTCIAGNIGAIAAGAYLIRRDPKLISRLITTTRGDLGKKAVNNEYRPKRKRNYRE